MGTAAASPAAARAEIAPWRSAWLPRAIFSSVPASTPTASTTAVMRPVIPRWLLLRPLLVAGDERTPGLCGDRLVRLPDHVELAVALHFANEHRLPEMVVGLVHLQREAGRSREGLAGHRLGNGVDLH